MTANAGLAESAALGIMRAGTPADAFELLDEIVSEAVMAAERAGLTPAEIAEVLIGAMAVRPGYPNMVIKES